MTDARSREAVAPRFAPRLAAAAGLFVLYAIVFLPVYRLRGEVVGTAGVLLAGLAGWLLGLRGGALAGLLTVPLTVTLYAIVTPLGGAWALQRWPRLVFAVAAGAALGWARDLLVRSRQQERALVVERERLEREVAERRRLADELRKLNAQLAEAWDQAVHANRAKGDFLSSIGHDLRSPLTSIAAYADRWRSGHSLPASASEDLDRVAAAARHLLGLIDDLLETARLESGRLVPAKAPFEIGPWLEEAVALAEPLARANRNALELVGRDGLGTMVSDPSRLRQALLNVLGNACKFTSGGSIRVDASRLVQQDQDWLVLRVTDTGIGMTQEQCARAFEPHWQAEPGRFEGQGLGLATTRALCRVLGGDALIESSPGRGSTMTLKVPAPARPGA